MTFYSRGSPVGWNGRGGGSGGKKRVSLSRRVLLGGKLALGRGLAF